MSLCHKLTEQGLALMFLHNRGDWSKQPSNCESKCLRIQYGIDVDTPHQLSA